jgi:hypothetical protein
LQLAGAIDEPRLQARAAVGLGRRNTYWEADSERVAALEGALAALPPGQDPLRVTLIGLLVAHLVTGLDPDQVRRREVLATELTQIAADASEPEMLLAVGQSRIYNSIESPRLVDVVSGRLARVAEEQGELRVLDGARYAQVFAALDSGDMPRLRWASEQYSAVAARLDDPREKSQAARVRSTIACIEGRYSQAEEHSDHALRLGKASGEFNAEFAYLGQSLLRGLDWASRQRSCRRCSRRPITSAYRCSRARPSSQPRWPVSTLLPGRRSIASCRLAWAPRRYRRNGCAR